MTAIGHTVDTGTVQAFAGEIPAKDLGPTLIHEHIFVTAPELDADLPDREWDAPRAIDDAVATLERLYDLGVRTVVDLTVLGLGRDVSLVAKVAERTRMHLIASTGCYAAEVLPTYFRLHGPGLVIDEPDPLPAMFIRDIEEGIAGTSIRAGMLKIASGAAGITPDVERIFRAAASAQLRTGVPITTHSDPHVRGGIEQQALLAELGVPLDRVVIGHSGDSTDLDYLRRIADGGSYLGFDRFGMTHVASDEDRVQTLLALLDAGYADRIVLSHDAAVHSRMTPPSWRREHTPDWHMEHLSRTVLPGLCERGVAATVIDQLMVENPRRLLTGMP